MSFVSKMVTFCRIPAGTVDGRSVVAFDLAKNPVTNEIYAAHVSRFLKAETPCVLLTNPALTTDHSCSIIDRGRNVEALLGVSMKDIFAGQDPSQPQIHGAVIVFYLTDRLSPEDERNLHLPNKPVVMASHAHAYEFCAANNFYLPSDDEWSLAAGEGPHATPNRQLCDANGKKLACFGEPTTIEVDDLSIPDGPNGVRHLTGEVWEATAYNPTERFPFGWRGGSFGNDSARYLGVRYRSYVDLPDFRFYVDGFRPARRAPGLIG